MKTGNTSWAASSGGGWRPASMEPGHEDREYPRTFSGSDADFTASMEPGHEDREYILVPAESRQRMPASMEPGHEDREYEASQSSDASSATPQWSPVMKTGNTRSGTGSAQTQVTGLNGARS